MQFYHICVQYMYQGEFKDSVLFVGGDTNAVFSRLLAQARKNKYSVQR